MGDRGSRSNRGSGVNRAKKWVLVSGDRWILTGIVLLLVFLVTFPLIDSELVTVGPGSSIPSTFGSGIVSGLFTLITVTLTINQLILSRVFGSPKDLRQEFEGSVDFRKKVTELTDSTVVPNDPAHFLELIVEGLDSKTTELTVDDSNLDREAIEALEDLKQQLFEYTDHVGSIESEQVTTDEILLTILGPEYAYIIRDTNDVRSTFESELSQKTLDQLETVFDLLEVFSVARQYFKTLALQQELARLSRALVYLAIPCLLVAVYTTLFYRTGAPSTVNPASLSWLISGAVTIVFAPLAVLLSHLLRISTLMMYTVSVGPFVPSDTWEGSQP